MSYPSKPTGNYTLRDYDFAVNDTDKLPMEETMFKNGYKNADESEVESVPDAHEQNWLFDILHRNLRYTMGVAEENKDILETKVATPTSIGQVKIGYGLEVTSNGVISVSRSIAENAQIISYDLPVGSFMYWAGNTVPDYFIEPSGQTLLRTSYPDLWQFAQDNSLVGTGKLFGAGDGSTTFTVADLRYRFIKASGTQGVFEDAGLPDPNLTTTGAHTHTRGDMNITGSFRAEIYEGNQVSHSGAFYSTTGPSTWMRTGQNYSGTANYTNFSAANNWTGSTSSNGSHTHTPQNSIYGNSTTVTPKNVSLKLILKALPTPPTNAVPTGTILDYTSGSVPDGYIIANGAELSRTTFSQLFNWAVSNNVMKPQSEIPSTAHAYYGTGDGSTTFTIPDLRGVFKRSADLASNRGGTTLGAYQSDGLPQHTHYYSGNTGAAGAHSHTRGTMNITGDLSTRSNTSNTGAFTTKTLSTSIDGQSTTLGTYFDASRSWTGSTSEQADHIHTFSGTTGNASDSIYGGSTTVQPKSIATTPILKY